MTENDDKRRAKRLIEGERGLSAVLASQRHLAFDLETASTLRQRLVELLSVLEDLLHDQQFWSEVEQSASAPLSTKHRQQVELIRSSNLTALLEAAGYLDPPPPPPGLLVEEFKSALSVALSVRSRGESGRIAIQQFKTSLALLLFVSRRRLRGQLSGNGHDGAAQEDSARKVLGVARTLILDVVAASGGAFAGAATGLGPLASAQITALVESGVRVAGLSLLGSSIVNRKQAPSSQRTLTFDAADVHVGAVADAQAKLNAMIEAGDASGGWRKIVADARDSLDRLSELAAEEGTGSSILPALRQARLHLKNNERKLLTLEAAIDAGPIFGLD